MKLTTAIKTVEKELREWQGQRGTMYSTKGTFVDDTQWEINSTTADRARERITEFQGMIGQEGEFEVDDNVREYRGIKQYKLKSWSGKPQPQMGGGFGGGRGGSYQPRYRDTEQGTREERESISRSVALQQAVVFTTNHVTPDEIKPQKVTDIAEHFYAWLVGPQRAAPASPNRIQAQATQSNRMIEQANQLFGDAEPPPQQPSSGYPTRACPNCGREEAVRKSKLDHTPPWYCYKKIGGCGHQWGDAPQAPVQETQAEQRSVAVMASEEIDKCVKAKDLQRLMKVVDHVAQAVLDKRISQSEMRELEVEVETGKKAIESGQSYDSWYRTKLAEVQRRSQDHHPDMQEMADRF